MLSNILKLNKYIYNIIIIVLILTWDYQIKLVYSIPAAKSRDQTSKNDNNGLVKKMFSNSIFVVHLHSLDIDWYAILPSLFWLTKLLEYTSNVEENAY